MKLPITQDLYCYRGQDWNQNLRIRIKSGNIRTIYPLDGYTAAVQIRPEENSDELSAEMICNITVAEGMISLALLQDQTADLMPGAYYYDLKTVSGAGRNRYWMKGRFIVDGRVTE